MKEKEADKKVILPAAIQRLRDRSGQLPQPDNYEAAVEEEDLGPLTMVLRGHDDDHDDGTVTDGTADTDPEGII